MATGAGRFMPNDCRLDPTRRMLVITGPNMGGKSTYMRQVALIVLLAAMGSYVPADACRLGPIDAIHTRIGAADDLANAQSTFMVEMTEAAAILHGATEHSLVLMDEIGRGTSTFDGLALACAIAHHLHERNRAFTLFATHYFELTEFPAKHDRALNVHVAAVESGDDIVFLHAIEAGPASRSYGVQVARLAGMPASLVRQARATLEALEAQRTAAQRPDRPVRGTARAGRARALRRRGSARPARARYAQSQGSAPGALRTQVPARKTVMTYCVGVKLDAGLVFLSDSRTNAGLDQISTFRKMMVYERPGDRFMVMLSAGNLSISQQVREILQVEEIDNPTGRRSRSGTRPACSTPPACSAPRCATSSTRTAPRSRSRASTSTRR